MRRHREPHEMHWRKFIIAVSAQVALWMLFGSVMNFISRGDPGWQQWVGLFSSIVLIAACAAGRAD
jgi:hypothetical protein